LFYSAGDSYRVHGDDCDMVPSMDGVYGAMMVASEPLTRDKMSPEFRKQTELVIDDFYQQLVETISAERKLDAGKEKDLIDEGLFTAAHAKEAGLIDHVEYLDEFRKELDEKQHVDDVTLVEDYGKKQLDEEDLSGFAGFMKMIQMLKRNLMRKHLVWKHTNFIC